ncbi:hypothetical protein [Burkholderia gladioli]|uniref:hypothetical protein n=1 Tax=Burkholderia gladioli TaxID=28095 RepID=UPI00163F626D|nr:hypothetical protein [Burkholderia gladioli]
MTARRPAHVNKGRHGDTYFLVLQILVREPLSAAGVALRLNMTVETARYHIGNLLADGRIHLAGYVRAPGSPVAAKIFRAGDPATAAQINPFLTAAGLIAAPGGQKGRVYQQHD